MGNYTVNIKICKKNELPRRKQGVSLKALKIKGCLNNHPYETGF